MKFDGDSKVIWCSRNKKGCNCPTIVKNSEEEFVITDDFGGSIKLTRDDVKYMKDTFKDAVESLGV